MTTAYTSLLGLALPVTGELSGTWGDTVNNSITSLLDTSVAGTTNVSTDADVTLTTTTGAANTARQAILLFSGARTALRTVTAPAQSKIYTVINATTGGFSVKLVGAGPTTGIVIANGTSATVAWNGSDFALVSTLSSAGVVPTTNGGTGLTSFTSGGVLYASSSSALTSGSALTFSGSELGVNATSTDASVSIKALTNAYASVLSLVANNDNGAQYNNISSSTSGGTVHWRIGGVAGVSQMPFSIAGSEQMRLTSTGLGIGTSSPAYKLDVNGNAQIGNATAATNRTLFINGVANKAGRIIFQESGVDKWYIGNGAASESGNFEIYNATGNNTVITPAGNLGLGVTPSAWGTYKALQIGSGASLWAGGSGNAYFGSNYYFDGSSRRYINSAEAGQYSITNGSHAWYSAPSGTAGNAITFTQAMTLDASGNLIVGATSVANPNGWEKQAQIYATTYSALSLNNASNNWQVANNASNLSFYFNSTERARIDTSGNLLVGKTSADEAIPGLILSANNLGIFCRADGDPLSLRRNNSDGNIVAFRRDATVVGSISVSTSATAYNTSSDYRLKENIQDADSASSLIDSLQVRKFDWKSDNLHQRYGFVAQELVTVYPEAVHQPADAEEMMAVDYSKLVPILVKEIQSLRKRLADAGI